MRDQLKQLVPSKHWKGFEIAVPPWAVRQWAPGQSKPDPNPSSLSLDSGAGPTRFREISGGLH